MRRYSVRVGGTAIPTSGVGQVLSLTTGTSRCCYIYEVIFGMDAAVADATYTINAFYVTAVTAGTAVTPVIVDGSGTAAVTTASSAPTSVTTTGVAALSMTTNSRVPFRWYTPNPDEWLFLPAGGGANGSIVFQVSQPGGVSGLTVNIDVRFAE